MVMGLFDDVPIPYRRGAFGPTDVPIPFAPDAFGPAADQAASPAPSLPDYSDQTSWQQGGGWGGLLSGIGATLGAVSSGWAGRPYSGEVHGLYEQMRNTRDQRDFRNYAREMSEFVPQGTREGQLWQAVASGNRGMQQLLPSLWRAQGYDAKAAAAGAPSQSDLEQNAQIVAARRALLSDPTLLGRISLENPNNMLTWARKRLRGGIDDPEYDRIYSYLARNPAFMKVPFSMWTEMEGGGYGFIPEEGQPGPTEEDLKKGATGWWDAIKAKARAAGEAVGLIDPPASTQEGALAAHLGIEGGAPSGETPPVYEPPRSVATFDPTMSLMDQYAPAQTPEPAVSTGRSLESGRRGRAYSGRTQRKPTLTPGELATAAREGLGIPEPGPGAYSGGRSAAPTWEERQANAGQPVAEQGLMQAGDYLSHRLGLIAPYTEAGRARARERGEPALQGPRVPTTGDRLANYGRGFNEASQRTWEAMQPAMSLITEAVTPEEMVDPLDVWARKTGRR